MKTTLFGLFGKVEIAAKQLRDSLVYFKLKVVAGAMVWCWLVVYKLQLALGDRELLQSLNYERASKLLLLVLITNETASQNV